MTAKNHFALLDLQLLDFHLCCTPADLVHELLVPTEQVALGIKGKVITSVKIADCEHLFHKSLLETFLQVFSFVTVQRNGQQENKDYESRKLRKTGHSFPAIATLREMTGNFDI